MNRTDLLQAKAVATAALHTCCPESFSTVSDASETQRRTRSAADGALDEDAGIAAQDSITEHCNTFSEHSDSDGDSGSEVGSDDCLLQRVVHFTPGQPCVLRYFGCTCVHPFACSCAHVIAAALLLTCC